MMALGILQVLVPKDILEEWDDRMKVNIIILFDYESDYFFDLLSVCFKIYFGLKLSMLTKLQRSQLTCMCRCVFLHSTICLNTNEWMNECIQINLAAKAKQTLVWILVTSLGCGLIQ